MNGALRVSVRDDGAVFQKAKRLILEASCSGGSLCYVLRDIGVFLRRVGNVAIAITWNLSTKDSILNLERNEMAV